MKIACLEINSVYIIIQQKKRAFTGEKKKFFGHSLTSWNTSMYSQPLCLLFLVKTIHSNYTPKTFSQTHNNMKHSHCSSLPVFVHASNRAGCNSEDILERAFQKSWYFQSSQDWAWDFRDVTNGSSSTGTYTGSKNWKQQKPNEELCI